MLQIKDKEMGLVFNPEEHKEDIYRTKQSKGNNSLQGIEKHRKD